MRDVAFLVTVDAEANGRKVVGKRDNQRQQIRSAVRGSQPDVLAKLVLDLCELNAENRAFVETRLALSRDRLESYKQRIDEALYPDAFSRKPIRIAEARRAVADYNKAAGDQDGLLELMIFYVERGTACTADYGDIDEQFYSSLESMYDRFLRALEKAGPKMKESYRPRAEAVVHRAQDIGWGFYDYLADRFAEAFPD
jgi:hypothetical protein